MLNQLLLGYRSLRRTPLFAVGVVLTLGLALAATMLVFSLVNSYVLRPLPFDTAGRLAVIYDYSLKAGRDAAVRVSFGNAVDLQEQAKSFSRLGFIRNESFTFHGPDSTEVAFTQRVTPEVFPMVGAQPFLGQVITPATAEIGGQKALLLSHSLWSRRFGADPGIIGRSVQLDQASYTVVGVMPPNYRLPTFDENPQAWVAMLPADYLRNDRGQRRHHLFAELAPGRSLASAQAELDQFAAAWRRDFAATNADRALKVISLRDDLLGNFGRQLFLLQSAVGLVLAVACLNCLCLLVARSIQRRREFAVRLALGASRSELVRQLFIESLWLALPAGILASWLAALGAPHLSALLPAGETLHLLPPPRFDVIASLVIFGLSLLIAFGFSLVPLLQTRRLNLEATLRDGGRQSSAGGGARAARWLVVGQIAAALALLVGAILLVRSYQHLQAVDRGLPLGELVHFRIGLRGDAYRDPARRKQFYDQVMANLSALPGVQATAVNSFFFVAPPQGYVAFTQEGDGLTFTDSPKRGAHRAVSTSYLRAVGLKLVEGRWLEETDTMGKPAAVVVSSALAQRHWPGQSPLGRRLKTENFPDEWLTVVGVVTDHLGLGNQPREVDSFYVSLMQRPPPGLGISILTRVAGSPPDERALQRAVWAVDPNMQFFNHLRVADAYAQSAWQTRFVLVLIGAFAALAVTLSLAGIYAVISFLVARRIAEFGIRIALGATGATILRQVLRESLQMTLAGLALGSLLAWGTCRSLDTLLFGVPAVDFATYLLGATTMAAACALAALVPARRAARVDPIVALRSE